MATKSSGKKAAQPVKDLQPKKSSSESVKGGMRPQGGGHLKALEKKLLRMRGVPPIE